MNISIWKGSPVELNKDAGTSTKTVVAEAGNRDRGNEDEGGAGEEFWGWNNTRTTTWNTPAVLFRQNPAVQSFYDCPSA